MARLDRLGASAKNSADRRGLGREFSYDLLAAVAQRHRGRAARRARPAGRGRSWSFSAVRRRTRFVFKHALVQDTAYGTLTARTAAVACTIGSPTSPRRRTAKKTRAPEIVAYHLQKAGRSLEAIVLLASGRRASGARAANREAIGHFRRALALLETQPDTAERWRAELAVLSELRPALMSVYGWWP